MVQSTYTAVFLDHIRTYMISNFIYTHILTVGFTDVLVQISDLSQLDHGDSQDFNGSVWMSMGLLEYSLCEAADTDSDTRM
jgi:hypothetical protein